MTSRKYIMKLRGLSAEALDLWLWFRTLTPAVLVAFGSFGPRDRARSG